MPNPDYIRCKECSLPVDVPIYAFEKHTDHYKQEATQVIVARQEKLI